MKVKVSAKITKCHEKNSYIFLHNNDCKTPYIDIYVDLLSVMLIIRSAILKSILHEQQYYS